MASKVVTLATATETDPGNGPFNPGQEVVATTATGSVSIRGVNHPGVNTLRQNDGISNDVSDNVKYLRVPLADFTTSGTDITIDSDDYPDLLNATFAVLSEANRLENVVRTMGVGQNVLGVLNRVTAAADPAAGEFKLSEAGGVVTLTLGELANTATYDMELWMHAAADITTTAVTQHLDTAVITSDIMVADVGAATITVSGV